MTYVIQVHCGWLNRKSSGEFAVEVLSQHATKFTQQEVAALLPEIFRFAPNGLQILRT